MRKPIQRIAHMNFKKASQLSFLSALLLSGCSQDYTLWSDAPWSRSSSQEVPCSQEGPVSPVVVPPETAGDQYVNYRQTAADYREYGERTPQDQLILSNGVGSNISAAIPPTIDEEVSDYENAVNAAFDEAVSESGANTGSSSGDDAVEDWLAEEGATLKGLLSEWCERAGWRLVWKSNRNYTLAAGAMFRGRFADVASALIRNFARARPAPLATFYKGNRVLVIETKEDENAYN